MQQLRAFFAEHRPDNVPRVAELYGKMGAALWPALEKKYPGATAKYLLVWDFPKHLFAFRSLYQQ